MDDREGRPLCGTLQDESAVAIDLKRKEGVRFVAKGSFTLPLRAAALDETADGLGGFMGKRDNVGRSRVLVVCLCLYGCIGAPAIGIFALSRPELEPITVSIREYLFSHFSPLFGFLGILLVVALEMAIIYSPVIAVFLYGKVKGHKKRKAQQALQKKQKEQEDIEITRLVNESLQEFRDKEEADEIAFAQSVETWRDSERYPVGSESTGVFSPYKPEMTKAETKLFEALSKRFDPYCLFADLWFEKKEGGTAQIDIVAICEQGILVIESKGRGGIISGKVDDYMWKQNAFGSQELHQFYNPIKQNKGHIEVLERVLECGPFMRNNIFSLIVFNDDARFDNLSHLPPQLLCVKALSARRSIG